MLSSTVFIPFCIGLAKKSNYSKTLLVCKPMMCFKLDVQIKLIRLLHGLEAIVIPFKFILILVASDMAIGLCKIMGIRLQRILITHIYHQALLSFGKYDLGSWMKNFLYPWRNKG